MKPSLKEDILATAKRLFNEKGYGSVTMREIASELGISVGNLTYHFPKKQDILQAIMQRNLQLTAVREPVLTLAGFHEVLSRMLDSLLDNAFYFREPALRKIHSRGGQNVDTLYEIMVSSLASLTECGRLRESFTERRRSDMVKILMLSHLTWLQKDAAFERAEEMTKEEFLRAHWSLLEPYLTEEGWEEYRRDILTVLPDD